MITAITKWFLIFLFTNCPRRCHILFTCFSLSLNANWSRDWIAFENIKFDTSSFHPLASLNLCKPFFTILLLKCSLDCDSLYFNPDLDNSHLQRPLNQAFDKLRLNSYHIIFILITRISPATVSNSGIKVYAKTLACNCRNCTAIEIKFMKFMKYWTLTLYL